MTEIIIETLASRQPRRVRFQVDALRDRVVYCGATSDEASCVVLPIERTRDTWYAVPDGFVADDLAAELAIHFPQEYLECLQYPPVASTLGGLVLLQPVQLAGVRISPLAAMQAMIERIAGARVAIVCAENDGMLVVAREGERFTSRFISRSLREYLMLSKAEQLSLLPVEDGELRWYGGADVAGLSRHGIELLHSEVLGWLEFADGAVCDITQDLLAIGAALLVMEFVEELSR